MRAVDTNVLVCAEIASNRFHGAARDLLRELAEGSAPWAIPWPCVYEFLRVVTHPRVFHPPVPLDVALKDLHQLVSSPSLSLLAETDRHTALLEDVILQANVTGNQIHDAHIVALCLEHGVSEVLTGDRDFNRFKGVHVIDPFATS